MVYFLYLVKRNFTNMKKKFSYPLISRIRFYLSYFFYKLIIFKDVKQGRFRIYLAEFIWVFNQFFHQRLNLPNLFKTDYVETKFGTFFITPDLVSTITSSPAYERLDVNKILKLIEKKLKKRKKVLFMDIGANFGLYTVIVGNKFRKYKNLDIVSFEPDTEYISLPAFKLLNKNVKENKLKNVKLHHFGLGNKDGKAKNRQWIKVRKLDSLYNKEDIKKYDVIFIKIDVDGYEKQVFQGAHNFIKNSNKLIVLVEDFIDLSIIRYLEKDFKFIAKYTKYNSFWTK